MNWNQLVKLISEKSVTYDDLQAPFKYLDFDYVATGDVILSTDDPSLSDAEVALYGIYELNDDGSIGDEIDRPPAEIIYKAQYALQDKANEIAAERGDFEGRGSDRPVFRDPDEPEPKD